MKITKRISTKAFVVATLAVLAFQGAALAQGQARKFDELASL
jgi:hypothetical protein